MTDFRIVGIEIKELDWTWGLTGEEANNVEKDEQEEAVEKKEAEDAVDHEVEEKAEEGAKEKAEETSEDQVLDQTKPAEEDVSVKVEVGVKTEEAEEKVGGKRKAQSPDGGKFKTIAKLTQMTKDLPRNGLRTTSSPMASRTNRKDRLTSPTKTASASTSSRRLSSTGYQKR